MNLLFFWQMSLRVTWIKQTHEIMKLLEEANDRGTTVLVVTHNQEIVNEMQKRVVTMKKGVIISDEKKVGISMRISTIGYSMKQGVKNIRRNKMFSVASIATMAACIFLFGLFYSIVVNFSYIVEKAEEGVAITVFLMKILQKNKRYNWCPAEERRWSTESKLCKCG